MINLSFLTDPENVIGIGLASTELIKTLTEIWN